MARSRYARNDVEATLQGVNCRTTKYFASTVEFEEFVRTSGEARYILNYSVPEGYMLPTELRRYMR